MNRLHTWYCQSTHWHREVRDTLLDWTLGDNDLGDGLLEIGAGPGVVTPLLAARAASVTSIDRDVSALVALRARTAHARAIGADATRLPFGDCRFSTVAAFTMLHHVAGRTPKRRLLREAWRVLQPGGAFVGCDATDSLALRLFHMGDTFEPVDPDQLACDLASAGFAQIWVVAAGRYVKWSASRP